ncbi:hypothetical protein PN36_21565 [Candidatus Thiomargarita nelsonii]|uniref:Uncharacterized protein n=1 Tax=Candidatus Thiomargarita nelsonii TaxID=1003181 RepID=A0A4E0RGE8_9GAMM|nr:hypothetical protein PN36_21565 [Candidatus Thiomargarita nelsonii]
MVKGCYHLQLLSGKEILSKIFFTQKIMPNGIPIPTDITWPKPLAHEPPWHLGIIARLDPIKDQTSIDWA